MPIVLYGNLSSPSCQLVWIVGKVLGIDIVLHKVDISKNEQKTEAFKKMNPAMTIPTLDDNGFQIWESRAIAGYLIQKYGNNDKLYPKDVNKRALVDNMLYFDFGMYSAMEEYYTEDVLRGKAADQHRAEALERKFSTLAKILEKRQYAAGDQLTVADIALANTLTGVILCGNSHAANPTITKYIAKIKKDMPAYEAAAKEGEAELNAAIKSYKA